jgi:hypothetical protein
MIDLAETPYNKPYVVPVYPQEEVIEIPKREDALNLAATQSEME